MEMVSKKIIFLDIDGVLNSENFYIARSGFRGTEFSYLNNTDWRTSQLDKTSIGILNYIIHETDAEIVLSSSWRYPKSCVKENQELFDFLKKQGFLKSPIDVTPRTKEGHRGKEIDIWLSEHAEITNYVIIDDDSDFLEHQSTRFVQTDNWNGLTAKNAYKVISILNERKN